MNSISKSLNSTKTTLNINRNQDSNSNSLIENFGFSPNFFAVINENTKLAVSIESEIVKNSKKSYEKESKETYEKETEYSIINSTKKTSNESSKIDNLYNPQMHFDYLSSNINNENGSSQMIKAYKSKHKKKYLNLYETNSINFNKENKNKLFHKCCYPGCNRTFSSSGWLKAHYKTHLKQIHNSLFSKLFRNIVMSNKIELMNQFNNNYFRLQKMKGNDKDNITKKKNL